MSQLSIDEEAVGGFDMDLPIQSFRMSASSRRDDRSIVISAFKIEKGADAGIRALS